VTLMRLVIYDHVMFTLYFVGLSRYLMHFHTISWTVGRFCFSRNDSRETEKVGKLLFEAMVHCKRKIGKNREKNKWIANSQQEDDN
ncbi:hypothetical protein KIN20_033041, partial [Parelaphostrongylus tenuis]